MRRLGLLGGMSWESTAEYYRHLNQMVASRLGGLHSADLVLRSVDFAEVEEMQAEGRWDDAGALLADGARDLVAAGAEAVLICTNTMHKVAGAVEEAAGVPVLHIADATAAAVRAAGVRRVALLGTRFTMEQDFYAGRLAEHGLEVVVPGEADRDLVHRTIYDELCLGVVREESRAAYGRVVDALVADGCEGVVLGCTEIELLVDPDGPSAVPLFPTARLHCEAAVAFALGDAS